MKTYAYTKYGIACTSFCVVMLRTPLTLAGHLSKTLSMLKISKWGRNQLKHHVSRRLTIKGIP